MTGIIEIEHLSKSFSSVKAVDDLSLSVRKGELYAFLGVNGAGKSTTINILCGQLTKDTGKIFIDGHDLDSGRAVIKRKLGVVFQNSVLDAHLSVYDNLASRASLYGIKGQQLKDRIDELAKRLDFSSLRKRTVGKLSGGQRRRIDVARALIHEPQILILDEPTTGLDPQTRVNLWNVVQNLRQKKERTVFLTTHYREEAADADYVVILDSGKIAAEGTPVELKNKYTGDFITLYNQKEDLVKTLNLPYEKKKDSFRIRVPSTKDARNLLIEHPEVFDDFEITKGKRDDVFLAVTGKNLEGGRK